MLTRFVTGVLRWSARRRCRKCATVGSWFDAGHRARIFNEASPSAVSLGDHVFLDGILATSPHGRIAIGSYSWIGEGAVIGSAASITIGSYVGIAANVHIIDNNNHPTEPNARKAHRVRVAPGGEGYPSTFSAWDHSEKAEIVIGDNVWIGTGSFIAKGVTVGEGAIIARQSVVTKDVPPFAVVAGNPARVVKQLPAQ